ncbi:MAG: SURF1 family protein [Candidatus Nanopelagicales bacterium]
MSRYGFVRQPKWLALGFVVLLVIPSFLLLSRWQLHRLDERRHFNDLVTSHSAAEPVPVDRVMRPGDPLDTIGDDQRWLPVTATGRYDAAATVLVRKRPLDGKNGFWVVTPLITSTGAVLAVNRGWVAAEGGATETQAVPAPPAGEVSIVGRIQPSEEAPETQPGDLPQGQVTDLSVPLVAGGAPAYPGYVQLVTSTPAESAELTPIPIPDLSDGPHLSYAVQWIFFAVVAVVGFVVLVRRESDYAAAEEALAAADTGARPDDVG